MKCWLEAAFGVLLASPLVALEGDPSMHDPSTIVQRDGRFYAIGTGAGLPIPVSEDGWTCIDDGVSKRLTLKKGANVIRGAIVNAGGATDFCARILDGDDRPIRDIMVGLSVPARAAASSAR